MAFSRAPNVFELLSKVKSGKTMLSKDLHLLMVTIKKGKELKSIKCSSHFLEMVLSEDKRSQIENRKDQNDSCRSILEKKL